MDINKSRKPELSLIIPCYNESRNIPLLLTRCAEFIERRDIELILVDNGSTDDTPELLKKMIRKYKFARVVRVDINQGYGFGILSGLKSADGEYLAWTHADMQTDPHDIMRGLELIDALEPTQREKIFVKGLRYGRPLADVIFTMGMSLFETILLRKRLRDINAQPTIFHRSFMDSWKNPPSDFSLDLFSYYKACEAKYQVIRFPVRFGERAYGSSHWNINWQAKVKFIKRTLSFSFGLLRKL